MKCERVSEIGIHVCDGIGFCHYCVAVKRECNQTEGKEHAVKITSCFMLLSDCKVINYLHVNITRSFKAMYQICEAHTSLIILIY